MFAHVLTSYIYLQYNYYNSLASEVLCDVLCNIGHRLATKVFIGTGYLRGVSLAGQTLLPRKSLY
jgi:hypothetical protein